MAEKKSSRKERSRLTPSSVEPGDVLIHVSTIGRSQLVVKRVDGGWIWGDGDAGTTYVVPLSECVTPETLNTNSKEIERRWGRGMSTPVGSSHDVD